MREENRVGPSQQKFGSGVVAVAILAATAGAMFFVADRFARFESTTFAERNADVPLVVRTRPADGERDVLPNASIGMDVSLPDTSNGATRVVGIDESSLTRDSVRLVRTDTGAAVEAHVNTSGAGDAIVLVPRQPLDAGATYRVEVSESLRDTNGVSFAPYVSSFTVSRDARTESLDVAYAQQPLDVESGSAFTAITVDPDGRLYAGTYDGRILRYDIAPDGTLTNAVTIDTIQRSSQGPRLIIGFAFDPSASPGAPVLWVSHGQMVPFENGTIAGADDWTGKITRLSGANLADAFDAVVHLPRGYKDHLNFQPAFGPDGALYFNQASHTSKGAPDAKWGMRPERLLTSAVLRLDLTKLGSTTLDAKTEEGGSYDPASPGAPLTIFATGIRSAYDMLWHSSGRLYSGLNGAASGGNTPLRLATSERPGLDQLRELDHTTDDPFIEIKPGRYYGHPNPLRNEFVLNGGNPSAGVDPFEVAAYPVGTQPEPNWEPPVLSFGKNISPNGLIELRGPAFGGRLTGSILVVRYSAGDDVLLLRTDARGNVTGVVSNITGLTGFTDPLDIAEDPRTGNLYLAEFGGQRITLLRPVAGSSQVYVQPVNPRP